MIYNKMKIVPIDTENREKYILSLHYGKVTNILSFWKALYKGLSDYKNTEEENFIIIDSLDLRLDNNKGK